MIRHAKRMAGRVKGVSLSPSCMLYEQEADP